MLRGNPPLGAGPCVDVRRPPAADEPQVDVADVVGVSVDDEFLNEQQAFSFAKANPLVYSHGHYFGLGKKIGKFGWSVEKKKTGTKK